MSDVDATGAKSPPRGVDSYFKPRKFEDPSPIVYPAAANEVVNNFKIQPNLIAILPVFRGHEEPYAHLREFLSIADTYQFNNTTKDGVRLRLFPFSLKDQAKAWFTSLELGSIHSWYVVPTGRIVVPTGKYVVLAGNVIIVSSGRLSLIPPGRVLSPGKGVPNVSHVSLNACSVCGDPSHSINNCQSWGAPSNEEVNGVYGNRPRNDPFFESYNLGWRNHPNFRWKDDDNYNLPNNTQQQNYGYKPMYEGGDSSNFQQNYHQQSSYQQRPHQYQNHCQGSSNGQQSNVDKKFDLILSELAKSNQGANLKFESLSKSVANLKRQMGQLAEEVHTRDVGKLPSYPDLNPKHKPGGPEHVNTVTSLQNGKTYNNDIKIPSVHDFSHDVEDFITDDEIVVKGKNAHNVKSDSELVNDFLKDVPKPPTQNHDATESLKDGEGGVSSTTTPYLAALEIPASARLAKKGHHSEDIWETFKKVKINLPLIDAIKQILAYAKFLNDLCTQKRKLKATLSKKIDLTEHVSAVLSSSLPPKFKDPGAPLISVVVGNISIKKALLSLGASINILPASLVDKYDLGTLHKTDTIISLSTKMPRGILEDVIVKVDEFYYPVDFFCYGYGITIHGCSTNYYPWVDVIDEEVQKHAPHSRVFGHLFGPSWSYKVEPLPANFDTAKKPSREVPLTLELKPLPFNLKYAFLGPNNTLPIIVASDLSGSQEEALLKVLSKYKAAVGWRIADLKRISPSLWCMMSIFSDMVGESVEIFMDDFSIFGQSFESCLGKLESVLKRCTETNLVLSWEKIHFMVREGIVLGDVISEKGFEVDRAKAPDWSKPFKIMCNVSDYAAGVVLGQRVDKKPVVIFYASKTFSEAQMNYTTTEKELIAVGSENVVADHLSRIIPLPFNPSDVIKESFSDESLFEVSKLPWYANIWSKQQRQYFFSQLKYYFWEDPELYKVCADQVVRRRVPDHEHTDILAHCHSYACGGHFGATKTGHKVLQSGFFWPTIFKDAQSFVKACTRCPQVGGISRRDQMPMNPILVVEIFDE
uniref:Retrovirus-related Pol polyprotein from transposon 297 family n=1 Tax=Tanacetum cinerariifolium TaxID=118510 RepID=A0A6L2P6K2_TANCI|nr:retrovirus-related Pol polyprotein from transposon 297 family [Tanacetum cinerariifolium]